MDAWKDSLSILVKKKSQENVVLPGSSKKLDLGKFVNPQKLVINDPQRRTTDKSLLWTMKFPHIAMASFSLHERRESK